MNPIDKLFEQKPETVLSVYFTAGYPQLTDTSLIIAGLEKAGADLIEIGFPFSDPVADGPVIQTSSHQALLNGMNLDILFSQLFQLKESSSIPKILMGYFNTVYQFGIDRFINQCMKCGISGVIIPDLPPEVYEKDYRVQFESAGLHFICLVSPQTSSQRAEYLTSLSRGFIYQLTSSSTTGNNFPSPQVGSSALNTFRTNKSVWKLPTLVGFGIHDHATFKMACRHSNGAIIGTAFIRHLSSSLGPVGKEQPDKQNRQELINNLCKEFIDRINPASFSMKTTSPIVPRVNS
jgi:tryptophan synthase alpha chain